MPADALPIPRVETVTAERNLRRVYLDALKRPLVGEVTISGSQRAAAGTTVVVPADVRARLVDGVLEVSLPAGTYSLAATLRTVDGVTVTDREDVTLD
jgi:hypothetical protein